GLRTCGALELIGINASAAGHEITAAGLAYLGDGVAAIARVDDVPAGAAIDAVCTSQAEDDLRSGRTVGPVQARVVGIGAIDHAEGGAAELETFDTGEPVDTVNTGVVRDRDRRSIAFQG